jgi:arylsulfatase A
MFRFLTATQNSFRRAFRHHVLHSVTTLATTVVAAFIAQVIHAQPLDAKSIDRPNIILIMADDLGYECLGAYGGRSYRTPNLDALAASGLRFDNCFSTPKCSPSRVTILTGRYTVRTTMKWGHIPEDEITFGHLLQQAGHATALAGKWQLGRIVDEPNRVRRFGFQQSAVWAWHEGPRYWRPMVYRNDKLMTGVENRYGPEVYTEFLIEFMEQNRGRPFLAYYPMCLTHYPKSNEPSPQDRRHLTFAEMVASMDAMVGKLVDALDRLELRDRTLILFTADNGSPTSEVSLLGDRRIKGGKAKLTDNGTRVPLIANWQGTVPGGKTNDNLIDFTDFLPTLADLAGAKLPPNVAIDGRSFAPQLRGEQGDPREWVFTDWSGKAWVRDKDWKLYRSGRLYDMKNDPEEKQPLPENQAADVRERLGSVMKRLKP